MRKITFAAIAAASLATAGCMTMDDGMDGPMSTSASASGDVVLVGGAEMYPNRTIVQNAVNSPIHTTLVKAVQAAGLVDTLNSAGPFTVFAPTDSAFGKVPSDTLDSLMQPAMKAQLSRVLTYHVVPGRITAADIMAKINAGGGIATYQTVAGENLTFTMRDNVIRIDGMGGSKSSVTQVNVMQSNGVIHVVDSVLLPTM